LHGFFKGLTSPLVGSVGTNAIVFGTYGNALRLLETSSSNSESFVVVEPPLLSSVFVAGTIAGVFQTLVLCPTDLVKCQMQIQDGFSATSQQQRVFKGPMECARQIYARRGTRGLFLGFWPTLHRDSFSFGIYFFVYEALKRFLFVHAKDNVDEKMAMLAAGGTAGVLSWASVYPMDVVKSCIQTLPHDATAKERTMRYQMQRLYRQKNNGGFRPFTNGLGTALCRAFPVNAVTFFFYEQTIQVLLWQS
jgi:solute carrier family 25 carnitine/acylcarnitine transporter 20/29